MIMKKNRLITILALVICVFLLAGCGSNDAAVQETPTPAVTEESSEAAITEEKTASDTAGEADTAKVTESVTDEVKDTATTDNADVTQEAKAEELQINWEDVKALETPIAMYAQQQVNIRKGPDTKYDKLGTLSLNDEVSVIGECKSAPWKEIKYKDDVAFVHADFLGTEKIDLEALKAEQEAAAATAAAQAPQEQQAQAAALAALLWGYTELLPA